MRRALLAAIVLLSAATAARAQAWLPSKGELTVSFLVSDTFTDRHDLNGISDPNSDIDTTTLLTDVTWGIRDDVALTVSLPLVSSKFLSTGTPPHPTRRPSRPARRTRR